MTAVQESPSVVLVTWNPSSDAQAYRIEYQCEQGGSGVVGATRNYQRLVRFQNGDTCNVSISATSAEHFPSDSVWVTVGLGKQFQSEENGLPHNLLMYAVPDQPRLIIDYQGPSAIGLTWIAPRGSVVTGYEIEWKRNSSGDCPTTKNKGNITITNMSITAYDIVGLVGNTTYIVTVKASNAAGSSVGATIYATTKEGGKSQPFPPVMTKYILSAAPSGPPSSVRVSGTTLTTITVQWGPVECNNGEITGYSVKLYREIGDSGRAVGRMLGTDQMEVSLNELTPAVYSIQVAAVNNVGTGPYSTALTAKVDGKHYNVSQFQC